MRFILSAVVWAVNKTVLLFWKKNLIYGVFFGFGFFFGVFFGFGTNFYDSRDGFLKISLFIGFFTTKVEQKSLREAV